MLGRHAVALTLTVIAAAVTAVVRMKIALDAAEQERGR